MQKFWAETRFLVLGVRNRVSLLTLWQFAAIQGRNPVSGPIATESP
ncbi:hypothetical protein [Oscillatoria sp. HE19RPO]|nr:hypothetical protein [Oscillatoria sp. HE19RPO]